MFDPVPHYNSRRSPLVCSHGAIATSQPLASEIGLRVLKDGGNAADACVAAVAALNCTEPCMCGIGGDAFCLFYDAKTKRVTALNGSGAAPAALTLELARASGGPRGGAVSESYQMLDPSSPHAVTVPGAAAAWSDASRLFGRKPLAEVLQPAIDLAEEGFPINAIAAELWSGCAYQEALPAVSTPLWGRCALSFPDALELLTRRPGDRDPPLQLTSRWGGLENNPGAAALLRPNRSPPKAGEWMRMPELAATFRVLAAEGPSGFYEGRIGKAIVEAVCAKGGVMSVADLAAHRTRVEQPISAPFAGHTVHQIAPNGSGLVSLLALRILDGLPPLPKPAGAAERMHRIIESLRLAFADGSQHVGDYRAECHTGHIVPPTGTATAATTAGTSSDDAGAATIERLLSDAYTAGRAALVQDGQALEEAAAGDVAGALAACTSETVYLTAVDGEGNACSFICSNYMGFGSGLVPTGCGFALHNRGANFRLGGPATHPNLLAPCKRPYHTIIPSMVTDAEGRLAASFGVMGGFMQPQGHVQVLINWLERGMDPQAALDQPRLCLEPKGTRGELEQPAAMQLPRARFTRGVRVRVEEGVGEHELRKLRSWGHDVSAPVCGSERAMHGRGQMIVVVHEPALGTAARGGRGAAEGAEQEVAVSPPGKRRRASAREQREASPVGSSSGLGGRAPSVAAAAATTAGACAGADQVVTDPGQVKSSQVKASQGADQVVTDPGPPGRRILWAGSDGRGDGCAMGW